MGLEEVAESHQLIIPPWTHGSFVECRGDPSEHKFHGRKRTVEQVHDPRDKRKRFRWLGKQVYPCAFVPHEELRCGVDHLGGLLVETHEQQVVAVAGPPPVAVPVDLRGHTDRVVDLQEA